MSASPIYGRLLLWAAVIRWAFTLDRETAGRIEDAAEILSKPKSQIASEAVTEYHGHLSRTSESERERLLRVFDTLVPLIPERPLREVEKELRELRRSGGHGGIPRKKA